MDTPADNPTSKQTHFAEVYINNQERLRGYVYTLVAHWNDAEEVFQRTSLCLWRKWEQFDQERDFLPWAFGIARLEAKRFLSERSRQQKMLSDSAMEALDVAIIENSEAMEERLAALEHCVKKLPNQQRSLLWNSYKKSASIEQVGELFGLSANAVYKRLRKIREQLHRCIDARIASWGEIT
ncbi:sigma-70 family RNA polymerase sigma factor [Bremerella sp. JC770]|uniref:sigma-70 family RNA polymerase sigma factor n=1 Tax=Bremerella sp. JC770 TaxID=3232137 RepID=UPI003458CC59